MLFSVILICFIVVVLLNLFLALKHLIFPSQKDSLKMVKALSYRIGFSLCLFVVLILGWFLNWWQPHLI